MLSRDVAAHPGSAYRHGIHRQSDCCTTGMGRTQTKTGQPQYTMLCHDGHPEKISEQTHFLVQWGELPSAMRPHCTRSQTQPPDTFTPFGLHLQKDGCSQSTATPGKALYSK